MSACQVFQGHRCVLILVYILRLYTNIILFRKHCRCVLQPHKITYFIHPAYINYDFRLLLNLTSSDHPFIDVLHGFYIWYRRVVCTHVPNKRL